MTLVPDWTNDNSQHIPTRNSHTGAAPHHDTRHQHATGEPPHPRPPHRRTWTTQRPRPLGRRNAPWRNIAHPGTTMHSFRPRPSPPRTISFCCCSSVWDLWPNNSLGRIHLWWCCTHLAILFVVLQLKKLLCYIPGGASFIPCVTMHEKVGGKTTGLWGNVCPARARRTTFLSTIPTSAPDLPSHGEAPQVDQVALHAFPTNHVA